MKRETIDSLLFSLLLILSLATCIQSLTALNDLNKNKTVETVVKQIVK